MKSISFDQLKTMLKSMSYPIFTRIGRAEKNVQSLTDKVSDLKTQIPAKPKKIIFRQDSSNEYTCDLTFDALWAMEPELIASNAILIDRYGIEKAASSARKAGSVEHGVRNIQIDIDGSFESDLVTYFKPTLIIDWWAHADATTINVHTASSLSNKTYTANGAPNVPILRAGNWGNYEIGEGLRVDGDALTVVEGEYELIERIIIGYELLTAKPADWETNWTAYYEENGTNLVPVFTQISNENAPEWEEGKYLAYTGETVKNVRVSKEPDGNPYKFISMMVKALMQPGEAANPGTINFRSSNYVNICGGYVANLATTTGRHSTCIGGLIHNRWFGIMFGGASLGDVGSNATVSAYPVRQGLYSTDDFKYLEEVILSATNNIPIGSVIEIWGVRPNE